VASGKTRVVVVVLAVAAAGCAERVSEPTPPVVLTGAWGGEGVSVVLTEAGGGVEFDCARGTIVGPIRLDGEGAFAARGTFVAGTGGPEPIDRPVQEATYTGVVRGMDMRLTVTLTASARNVGLFLLKRSAPPRLRRCL
jgi:hypothetical protein